MNKSWIIALCSLLIIIYSFFFFSCKKNDTPVTHPSSLDYFPTLVGHWVIYDVDSIVHLDNDGNTDDSIHYFHFQVKELITSTFIDGQGRPTQRIERYHRDNDSAAWYITDVWTSTLTATRAEREEDNIRYMPLAFPINYNITWDSNAFNQLGEDDYNYIDFHVPLTLNALSFDSTLDVQPVLQAENNNFVQIIYEEYIYAVHVGRIYKAYQNLLKYGGQVVSGLDYHETINSYGNN